MRIKELEGTKLKMKNMPLEGLSFLQGVLEISLLSNIPDVSTKNKIIFDCAMSFRVTDEGDLLKTQNDLSGDMICGVYTVEKSDYLVWYHEQSYGIHQTDSLCHYLVVTSTEVIDVLSASEPEIITIN
ncbi:hypothetical protein [Type-E symbiont of Plautia stali]|uniref:hypothetical protein n=1 Tax=Type-E symbiont of Plautia stali TaxID=1560357 RepID=UPI002570F0FD|nr:hypothetical protein [Type-E symbiont of Plautia stali]